MSKILSAMAAAAIVATAGFSASAHSWQYHFANDIPYRVVNIEPHEVLNVRAGPGVHTNIVGYLRPGVGGIRLRRCARHATWCLVEVDTEAGMIRGWVSMRFLTGYAY